MLQSTQWKLPNIMGNTIDPYATTTSPFKNTSTLYDAAQAAAPDMAQTMTATTMKQNKK